MTCHTLLNSGVTECLWPDFTTNPPRQTNINLNNRVAWETRENFAQFSQLQLIMATLLSHPHLKPNPSPRQSHFCPHCVNRFGYVSCENFDTVEESNCHKNEFSKSSLNFAQLLYKGLKCAQKSFINSWNTKTMDSVPSLSNDETDVSIVSNVNNLMYRFDV